MRPGAFAVINWRIAFDISLSVGGSQQIIISAKLDYASFTKWCKMK